MIQRDVKSIGILGKFLAKKKNVVNRLIPHTNFVMIMQKNIGKRTLPSEKAG